MAELNFGLLNPPGSQSIGNAFVQGMDQAQESRARDLQMQQSMRKGQMDELTYRKALDTESRLNKYYADIAANGGPKTSEEAEKAMMNSGVAHIQDMGAKAQLLRLQNAQTLARFREANPANVAAPMAPAVAPAPGSFGAAVADRTAADPFRANMMPGAAAAPADRNNLIANLNSRIDANVALGTAQGYKQAEQLRKQVDDLTRLYPVGNTLMGGQGQIIGTAPRQTNLATDLLIPGPNGTMVPNTALIGVKGKLAVAGRAPAQPSAPTITQIVDPTDATKMITIDARRYTGGGAGSPGVIGVSGKEPTAALRENKIETGKSLLADEISNLRAALNTLNAARAIPSTERGALSNISSSLASSGVGQIAGRIVGTEAQTERDVISSSKLRLVNAIKQATGMSAQQLNSNVELQTMLKSLSDPSQSIEANIRNLDNIEKSYVNATSAAMPRAPAAATTTSKAAPAMGAIQDGYRFKGGDPAKASNWEKVGG